MELLLKAFESLKQSTHGWSPKKLIRIELGKPLPVVPNYDTAELLKQLEYVGGVSTEPEIRTEFHNWLKAQHPYVKVRLYSKDGIGYYTYRVNQLVFYTTHAPIPESTQASFNPEHFLYYARRIQALTVDWAKTVKHRVRLNDYETEPSTALPLEYVGDFHQFDKLVQTHLPEYFGAISLLLKHHVKNSCTNVHERDSFGIVVASVQINNLLFVV